ncbi:MAG: aminoglycoside phosphotransferase family protein [Pseudomonadaceae bacterium]|nr:aminoglycoside phosphotransferase family protein [Pseudomonadaceae bacterium]
MHGTPKAEVDVSPELVRLLVAEQFPQYANHTVSLLANGFDNVNFRVGPELIARLPRRSIGAELIRHEQTWLPKLAPNIDVSIPVPIHAGQPSDAYPWPWSLVRWREGATVDLAPLNARGSEQFLQFLEQVHRAAPADAPTNAFRGVPLSHRVEAVEDRFAFLLENTNLVDGAIESIWQHGLDVDQLSQSRPRTWLHGDLHPRNVLSHEGELAAVLDWGDMCAGDPASDLASIWLLFPDNALSLETQILSSMRYDGEQMRARLRGWAVLFGVLFASVGFTDDPRHFDVGRRTLRALSKHGANA